MNKVNIVVKISTGEDRLALDETEVFDTYEKAKEYLEKLYHETLDDVEGYDLLDDELGENYFIVEIDDDYSTKYYGRIKVREIQ